MTTYWFRPKRFGYGVTPNTWQGWLFTVIMAAAIIACVELARRNVTVNPLHVVDPPAFWSSVLGALIVFFGGIYVSVLKTDGGGRRSDIDGSIG